MAFSLSKLGGHRLAAAAASATRSTHMLCLPAVTSHSLTMAQRGRTCQHHLALSSSSSSSTTAAARGSTQSRTVLAAAAAASPTASDQQAAAAAEDAFYAETAQSFSELGLEPAVVEAIQTAGFARPSRVQELVIPKVLSGKDIVLAAETGSGKTLAYIAPLASLLMRKAASGQQPPSADVFKESANSSSTYKPKARPQHGWMGLVLCPNTALCHQVVRLVSSLQGSNGQPILRAAHVSSSSPPPFDPPDIVVTTPGALKTLFNDRGAMYGSQWTAEAVSARSAFVVVDEADLLWQGGYVKDLTRLLDAFKAAERRVMEAQVLQELSLDRSSLDKLPRTVREALWRGGVPAMFKAGFTQPKLQRLRDEQQPGPVQQRTGTSTSEQGVPDAAAASTSSSRSVEEDGDGAGDRQRASSGQGASTSGNDSGDGGSGAEYGPYFRRQHLFVAATMPALTKGDVGTELQKRFKGALWVSGDQLHQVQPHVDHTWVRVGKAESDLDEALLAAIQSDPDYAAGRARVLVFTRNTANADRVSSFLQDAGVANYVYHKNLPPQAQADALSAMAHPSPESNLVMVSTDAAARGIDLPRVTHVIQADFVANAIEFLHRVGRTARAGRSGKVTSLYGPADAVLAEALRQYIEAGQPVEECFSRNRSFSRKVKRYGKFVPRGVEGPQDSD